MRSIGNQAWIDFFSEHQLDGVELQKKDLEFFKQIFWSDLESFKFLWNFLIIFNKIKKNWIQTIIDFCIIPMLLKPEMDVSERIEFRRIANSNKMKFIMNEYPESLNDVIIFEEKENTLTDIFGVEWIENFAKSKIGFFPNQLSKINKISKLKLNKSKIKCYRASFDLFPKLSRRVLIKFPELVEEVCYCLNENGTKSQSNIILNCDRRGGVLYNQHYEGRNYLKMISLDGKHLRWFFRLNISVNEVEKISFVKDSKNRKIEGFLAIFSKKESGEKLRVFNYRTRKVLKKYSEFDQNLTDFSLKANFKQVADAKSFYSKLPVSSMETVQTSCFNRLFSYHLKDNFTNRNIFMIFNHEGEIVYEARSGLFEDRRLLWHEFIKENEVLMVFDCCLGIMKFKGDKESRGECEELKIIEVGLFRKFQEDFWKLKIRRFCFDVENKILDFKVGSGRFKMSCVKLLGSLDLSEVLE